MTFRRDWRRQGGCRRHSGGCRVSAAVGKPRTYVIGTGDGRDGCGRMRAVKARVPVSLRVLVALRSLLGGAMDGGSDGDEEPRPIRRSETGTRVAWKKTLPEDADEVSVAPAPGSLPSDPSF
ncbi:hypothetical protein THAOC_06230, partial [Thalassiosira oceanica]